MPAERTCFVPAAVEHRGALTVEAPIDQAFSLFSPEGERAWVPGWDPELLHPPGAVWERGLLFRTQEETGEAVWVVTALDRDAHDVEYHRVEPGRYVARVRVRCAPSAAANGSTDVAVAYTFVGLSESGNAEVRAMTPEAYAGKMARWSRWIAGALAGGTAEG